MHPGASTRSLLHHILGLDNVLALKDSFDFLNLGQLDNLVSPLGLYLVHAPSL
jgi:hypothetical protein